MRREVTKTLSLDFDAHQETSEIQLGGLRVGVGVRTRGQAIRPPRFRH